MCLPYVFLKLLRVEWKKNPKINHLNKNQRYPESSRKFQKQTLTEEKYVKVKICQRVLCVITFTCQQLLFLFFFAFQRFILKFNKKVKSPRVPSFVVLSLRSWVLGPGSCSRGSCVLIIDYPLVLYSILTSVSNSHF